jgi:hypothetical protein
MLVIKQSFWICLTILALNLSFLVFVNLTHVDSGTESLLAIPCSVAVSFSGPFPLPF